MKLSQFKQFLILCVGLLLITSCGGNNASRATGWDINSKSGGFQFNVEFEDQETGPGLVFVEGGTYTKGQVQDDVMHDWNNTPNKQHVMSFYIDETEVTNLMYLEYLDWLEYVFPTSEPRYRQIYEGVAPRHPSLEKSIGLCRRAHYKLFTPPCLRRIPCCRSQLAASSPIC